MKHLLILTLFFMFEVQAKVVLIDPGHGGEEAGAVGPLDPKKTRKAFEKDLALRLSKKIKNEISKTVSSYLTRSLDRSVTLQQRANLADLVKADLFLSIHFNSSPNLKSHGFELYYLDNNSNVAANKVERAENLNLKGEDLVINQILIDLVVQQTVTHSKQLAAAESELDLAPLPRPSITRMQPFHAPRCSLTLALVFGYFPLEPHPMRELVLGLG